MTATTFKERYANHTSSFRHTKGSNKTELSKHNYLEIKRKQSGLYHQMVNFKHAISYTGGSKRCNLCLEEKLCILKDISKDNLLNKRQVPSQKPVSSKGPVTLLRIVQAYVSV
jgi:hypothetical protein